jgi:uncharacterized protein YjiK
VRYLLFLQLCFSLAFCERRNFTSPPGYDLAHPEKHFLKNALREISGICFAPGTFERYVYAIQDEDGKIFRIGLDNNAITSAKFGRPGDYEDLVFARGKLFVLESKGVIVKIAYDVKSNIFNEEARFSDLLPVADYEGLSASGDTLLVLCKTCTGDVTAKSNLLIYKLLITDAALQFAGSIMPAIMVTDGNKKEKIYPSALAQNPLNKNWYVLSGRERLLLLFDANFSFINFYPLNPKNYQQPEGITFDNSGNMYISSEGKNGSAGLMVVRRK